ncbi:DBIRD complex subunit ZNF326 isoform X2 [Parasteatoda tepidariorum]|nr:uncharacterized protein LOC107453324 [Parasteatoda tepidariorum]
MNNNHGYGGFPASNSSFQSFSSQYASTPTNNNTRFQRPRFAYAGPPSYPRPRSSASKPNPDPYDSFQSFNSEYDSNKNSSVDYSHGYGDSMSMRNNFGDTSLHMNDSLTMNQSRNSFDDSSSYVTCSESFYQSPLRPDYSNYDNKNLSFGPADRGGRGTFSNNNALRQQDTYSNTNVGGSALFNNNPVGISPPNSVFRGLTGTFATSTKGPLIGNTRGRGTFGQNRGYARGGFQKKKPFGRGGQRSNPAMASKSTWKCEICSIQFTSQIPLDMHLRGSKHAKKLKSQTAFNSIQGQITQIKEIEKSDGKKFYCELCDIIANSSLQLQMHLDGTKHKNKLTQSTENTTEESKDMLGNKNVKEKEELNGKSNGGGGGVRRPAPADFSEPQPVKMTKFSCDICNIFMNSEVQLQQHLTSKKHQAKVEGKPIIKKRKFQKQDEEGVQPIEQQPETENETKVEPTSVVGVKTLSASFVRSENLL